MRETAMGAGYSKRGARMRQISLIGQRPAPPVIMSLVKELV
jgi:hypothetical protein